MSSSQRLISNASVSVVQTIISGLVLFVLYRYLIDHLGTKQLGLWSVILASTSVARLSDMGLTGSVVKFVARYRALNDDIQAADVIQTAAISIAGVMGILCLIIYPLLDNVLALAIPAESMSQALSILPWAVFSLWLGSVGGVFQSGLDGCQRMDTRNILMILGNLIFLVAAFWLVPNFGLMGLAIGQVFQALILTLASWVLLRRQLKVLPLLPKLWRKSKFKEMFGYSVNFQINSIAILLFDPAIKLLMSRYGGLSSTAFYEMASQLVVKLRALIVSANQALVPAVAELHETAPEQIRNVYLKTYRMLFFVTVPFYAGIYIALPLVSQLWIGHIESQFLIFGAILTLGWGLNTLTGPAYFVNLGTGDLKWNSISHVLMAFLNVILGLILGPIFGGFGVAVAAMVALVTASIFVIFALYTQYKIPLKNLVPAEHYGLLVAVAFCISIFAWGNAANQLAQGNLLLALMPISLYVLILSAVVWVHPYRKMLLGRFKSRDGSL